MGIVKFRGLSIGDRAVRRFQRSSNLVRRSANLSAGKVVVEDRNRREYRPVTREQLAGNICTPFPRHDEHRL